MTSREEILAALEPFARIAPCYRRLRTAYGITERIWPDKIEVISVLVGNDDAEHATVGDILRAADLYAKLTMEPQPPTGGVFEGEGDR